ncbi:MAG TPA: ATP-binding protein [Verrucomicrobiae bacterium]|jgi:PAS domain S-box-containing protein|nr:ATP-binding protein [Verrucomicrobiae bacterium]
MKTPKNSNGRLLIIDDNQAIHGDFAKILGSGSSENGMAEFEAAAFGAPTVSTSRNSFDLSSAFQGQEGLQMVQRALDENRPYAMAFVDIQMPPGWDGVETAMKIWEVQPDLQIIICTAYSDYSWDEMIAKVGRSDQLVILKKPFDNVEVFQLANAMTKKWLLSKQAQLKLEDMERTIRSRTAELHSSHSEMETLLASVSAAIIGLDRDKRVVRWNNASTNIFGISQDQILGQPLFKAGIQWNWELVQRSIDDCQKNRMAVELDCVEYRNAGEQNGFINLVISPSQSSDSKSLDIILLATEITQRRSVEAQLRQAQKLKVIGQLAAGIAHELNTPAQYVGDNTSFLKDAFHNFTGAIQACQDLLAKRSELTPELLDQTAALLKVSDLDYLSEQIPAALDETLEGIKRISEIVKAMKDFSHPGSQGKTPSDLNKAIKSTVTVSRSEWKYVADLTLKLEDTLPLIPCLVGEFNQVILNLIVNAAHAIGDVAKETPSSKGVITISTSLSGNFVEVQVADTGTGIPESAREKLFEPFFTTKEVGKGTGQGLFIARNVIVEKHGGTIDFETKMGAGTTFIIRLPLSNLEKQGVTPIDSPAPETSLVNASHGERVLV